MLVVAGGLKFANSSLGRDAVFSRFYPNKSRWSGSDALWTFAGSARNQPFSRHLERVGVVGGSGGVTFWHAFAFTNEIIVGFAMRLTDEIAPDAGSPISLLSFYVDNNPLGGDGFKGISLEISKLAFPNTISIKSATGVTLATVEFPTDSQWHYVELKSLMKKDSSGTFELRIDETVEASGSGVTCHPSAPFEAVNEVRFFIDNKKAGSVLRLGDIYVVDNSPTSGYPTGYLGDCATASVLETADSLTQWAPGLGNNYSQVNNELPGFDGDSSYISTASASAVKDLYTTFPSPGFHASEVFGMKVMVIGRMESNGIREVAPRFKTTDGEASAIINPAMRFTTAEWTVKISDVPINPITQMAWTLEDLYSKSLEWGVIQEV